MCAVGVNCCDGRSITRTQNASIGDEAGACAFRLSHELRARGLRVDTDHVGRSVKAQFKYAGRTGARYALAIGSEELAAGRAKLKDMRDGTEREVALDAQAIHQAI